MFFIVSKIFEILAAPLNLALLLGFAGLALTQLKRERAGRRLFYAGFGLLALVGLTPLAQLLAWPLETRFPAPRDDMPAPDGIIVLGGSVDEFMSSLLGHTVFSEAVDRVTAPIELRRRFPNARLVFSGGSSHLRDDSHKEADAVRRFWRQVGLDQGDALYERESRNTYENAVFTRELTQPKPGERWLLITSALHMPRSVGIFRRIGFPVEPYPVDYRTLAILGRIGLMPAPMHSLQLFQSAMHEWIGLVAYRLTDKTDALFPGP